jgi:hypothetical protein
MEAIINMNMHTEARNAPCSNQSGQTIGAKLRSNQLQLVIAPLSLVLNLIYIFIYKADLLIGKIRINTKRDASTKVCCDVSCLITTMRQIA